MCTRALKRERFVPSTSGVLRSFALTVGAVKLIARGTGCFGGGAAGFLSGNGNKCLMSTCIIWS
jgi:hypothetical protein